MNKLYGPLGIIVTIGLTVAGIRYFGALEADREEQALASDYAESADVNGRAGEVDASSVDASFERGAVTPTANDVSERPRRSSGSGAMKATQIIDHTGFDRPMLAFTGQIPEDWTAQGGVGWDRTTQCATNQFRPRWIAVSPSGEHAFEVMPGYNWQLQGTQIQMNPCPTLGVRSVREFLEIISQRHPNARVIEYRDRPDLVKRSQPVVPNMRMRDEAGQIVIAYDHHGRDMRAILTASATFSELGGNIVGGVPVVYAQRAPRGELDGAIGERIMQSLQPDPTWMAEVQRVGMEVVQGLARRQREGIERWHAAEMAKINARGEMARSQIRMRANAEVAQIYADTWASGQATDDRIHRRNLEGIGSYNSYADPSSGRVVRESIEFDRVLRNADGSYLSTNDPYLNPAGSEELQRIR